MKAALDGSRPWPAKAQATCRGVQPSSRLLSSRHCRSSRSERLQQFVHNRRNAQTKAAAKLSGVVAVSAVAEPPAAAHIHEEFPRGARWQVHKFGGTCVATAQRIMEAAQLIARDLDSQKVVVVSAMGSHPTSPVKVTDVLLTMVAKAAQQNMGFLLDLNSIQEKHVETAKLLLGEGQALNTFLNMLLDDIANLKAMLHAISIAGISTDAFSDFVVGYGEIWCANLFSAYLKSIGVNCAFMDTRTVLVVTPTSDGISVDVQYERSDAQLDKWGEKHGVPDVIVATGFIAKNPQGQVTALDAAAASVLCDHASSSSSSTKQRAHDHMLQVTTLRRNGSDYSATIVGALFRAAHITIWTDVNGVYSADPRKVPEAVCLTSLSYHEAWELSYFGASVMHPRTTLPAMRYSIPITIRNFFNQGEPGTQISDLRTDMETSGPVTVKGFATIDNVALINVEGTGMVGVPGTASTIFSTVRDAGVNVIMISQASSEHSVCFAVRQEDAQGTVDCLSEKFRDAIRTSRIHHVESIDNCCVLAAVGQQMASRKGVSAAIFSSLAKANINIRAIAQGCSEYNITILVDQRDAKRALRTVHGRFYLASLPIAIGIVGMSGQIGTTFMQQLRDRAEGLKKEMDIDVRVIGVTNSSQMLLSEQGLSLTDWEQQFERQAEPADLQRFGDHIASSFLPNTVIVDATASEGPPAHYMEWLQRGIHIITPNKKLGSGPLDHYRQLRKFQRDSYIRQFQREFNIHFLYEATVGAGLPVIATLQHLVHTGDKITRIEGIFSGTLSYIFNSFTAGTRFSEVVATAKELGYTEPDPRDDLAGMDVARKVTILAREAGLMLELGEVAVQSLVPEPLQSAETPAAYMKALPEFDSDMDAQLQAAEAEDQCLRFVGVVDVANGSGSVELKRYPKSHPFAQLSGSDNIIAFTTQRYAAQPLIVRGPGAGREVTAGGVFSDLLRLAAYLGAPS